MKVLKGCLHHNDNNHWTMIIVIVNYTNILVREIINLYFELNLGAFSDLNNVFCKPLTERSNSFQVIGSQERHYGKYEYLNDHEDFHGQSQ